MDKGKKLFVVGALLLIWLASVAIWGHLTTIHFPDGSKEISTISVIGYVYSTSIGILLLGIVLLKEFGEYLRLKNLDGLIHMVVVVWGIAAMLAGIASFTHLTKDSLTGQPLIVPVIGVMVGIPLLFVVISTSEYKGYQLDKTITATLVVLLIVVVIGMAYEGYRAQNDAIEYVMKYYDLLMKYNSLQAECGV